MIARTLRALVRAVTGRTQASAQAGDTDFNREMTDSELSRIVGGDPPGAPSYHNSRQWFEAVDAERFAQAWRSYRGTGGITD